MDNRTEEKLKDISGLDEILENHKAEKPQGDVISRQAAKDRIKAICEKYHLSYEDGERKTSTGGSAYAPG